MVQIKTEGFSSTHSSHKPRHTAAVEYWMLQNENDGTLVDKKRWLDQNGANYNVSSSRSRLEELCQRVERGLYVYDKLSVLELRGFVAARQLPCTTVMEMKKPNLIQLLERADDSKQFRLLDLPPELRIGIFRHHFRSLDTMNGHLVTLPPLTRVSKLVRKESIPLFHEVCTFHLDLWSRPATYPEIHRFFAAPDTAILRGIRKLHVASLVTPGCFRWSFTIQVEKSGAVTKMEHVGDTGQLNAVHRDALDAAVADLQEFYQKLVDRRQEAKAQKVLGNAQGFDSSIVPFVAKPDTGLDLRSSDLAELKAIFEHRD